MKKAFRQSLIAVIFIMVIAQMYIVAFAAPSITAATSDFYVNDFAEVFSSYEKADLMERAVDLANTYDGIQVVVTTVTSLDGNTVEEYATAMYNQYGIGRDDMGLLILLSTGDRKVRVEVGKKMEAYVNDAKAGRFMDDYAIPKLKDNKFNEGLISLQTEIIKEIKACIDKANAPVEPDTPKEPKEPIVINWGAVGIVALAIVILGILVVIALIIYKKSKKIEELEETISKLHSKLQRLEVEASDRIEAARRETKEVTRRKEAVDGQYADLNGRFNTLKDRYRRGTVCFPDLDAKVDAMIEEEIRKQDMAKAASVDSAIQQVIGLSASKDALAKFEQVIRSYDGLNKKQQRYVKGDVSKVRSLCEQSTQLKYQHLAGIAVAAITAIIAGISVGKEKHIRDLERAKSTYDQLDSGSQKYVEKGIPEQISQLLTQAKRDKKERENREEEERRRRRQREEEERRRQNSNNSSSFGGGSSGGFGGFGGSSGGGGASRGF